MNEMVEVNRWRFGVLTKGLTGKPVYTSGQRLTIGPNLAAMQYVVDGKLVAQAVYMSNTPPSYRVSKEYLDKQEAA